MLRSRPTLAVLAALLTALPAAARAQDAPAAGARVRAYVVPPGAWRVGALVRLTGDTLVLRPERCQACAPETFPRAAVARFDVSAGPGGHALRGMGLGLVAGALLGAVLPCRGSHGSEGPPCGLGQAVGAVWGAFGGAIAGGVVGAYWPPRERWRPAAWP